jgi:uncharacterized MnhB-related membrane protein
VNLLILVAVTLAGATGTVVALTGQPDRQAISLSVFGLALTMLFIVLQAPDAALSQLVIGGAVVPLMVMLTIRTVRRHGEEAGR